MKKEELDVMLYDIREFLNNHEDFKNMNIEYLLVDKENINNSIALAYADDYGIEINLKDFSISYAYDWSYDIDTDMLNELEKGKDISFMSPNWHYNVWCSIEERGIEEIVNKNGMQNYLQYCVDNGITKEYLDEKTGLNTPDIMNFFDGLAVGETIEYKGYIIEVDDTNLENDKENLVQIYQNRQDYIKGENIETVSLNTIGLKQNIKDYIDEVYVDQRSLKSDKAYFTFVLGYDLLNNMLSKSSTPENDVNYNFCNYISEKFLKTNYYKNERCSSYDMLQKWVNDNKEIIQSEYLCYSGIDDKAILEIGNRGATKVALVERMTKYGKEYIVAFGYKVDDKKVEWDYGYYYDKEFAKAKLDFEKVKAGGNLADTFEKKNNKKNKERER